ncbi:rho GTPase-activating protein 5 [Lates japonicus]|uniref:Rho GTPase-activating protein 5 n=1 Tax=Lates japonicus TaxID=270547 RepID=A0AAD3NGZ3_LATJO|nr:rho GTPase-activating protein 5 [Lates japonicus]
MYRVVTFCGRASERSFKGLTTEGLYRVSGNKTDQDNIQKQFDQDHSIDFVAMDVAVNAAAGALKAFFADLPDPLIPYNLHPELVEAATSHRRRESDGFSGEDEEYRGTS